MTNKKHKLLFILGPLLLLSSCSIAAIRKHEPNFKSTREISTIGGTYRIAKINTNDPELVKRLRASHFECRMTRFEMPANKTVEDFLREAFTDELDAAGKLSAEGAAIEISVKKLESSTGLSKGAWDLELEYSVNGKSFDTKTKTVFESAFTADTACRNTANSLTDALTDNFLGFIRQLKDK